MKQIKPQDIKIGEYYLEVSQRWSMVSKRVKSKTYNRDSISGEIVNCEGYSSPESWIGTIGFTHFYSHGVKYYLLNKDEAKREIEMGKRKLETKAEVKSILSNRPVGYDACILVYRDLANDVYGLRKTVEETIKDLNSRVSLIESQFQFHLDGHPFKDGYLTYQEACKRLKVGMKVKILRQAKGHSDGWNNSWTPEMDKYVGETHTVKEICGALGVKLEGCSVPPCLSWHGSTGKDFYFFWPVQVLEPVKESEETYQLGDIFEDKQGTQYILVCPDGETACLINMKSGNCCGSPTKVANLDSITRAEFYGLHPLVLAAELKRLVK